MKLGCNLGTILYSIAMHPTFVQSIEGFDVSAKACADDFSAVATPKVLLEVIDRLSNSIYGLNPSKTPLLNKKNAQHLLPIRATKNVRE